MTANTKKPKQPKPPMLLKCKRLDDAGDLIDMDRLGFRLPKEVADDWRQQAKNSGKSLSDWIRSKIDADQQSGIATPSAAPKRKIYTPVDPDLLRQVATIGNNLNQLARIANSFSTIDSINLLSSLSSLRQDLSVLIDKNSGVKDA